MKKLLPYCLILCGIMLCTLSCSPKKHSASKSVYHGVKADSGYITEASLRTLFKINPEDTLFKNRGDYMPADTVGKYFINRAGNYIACINIFSPDGYTDLNVVIEALADGTIKKEVSQWVGMYRCCWPDMANGLQMHGDYFSIPVCGTGSAYCSGELCFFKDVAEIETNGLILQSIWTGSAPSVYEYFTHIYAQPEVRNDTIIMHYTRELLKNKKLKFKVKKSETFDVAYTLKPTGWAATDSTRLKEIEQFLY